MTSCTLLLQPNSNRCLLISKRVCKSICLFMHLCSHIINFIHVSARMVPITTDNTTQNYSFQKFFNGQFQVIMIHTVLTSILKTSEASGKKIAIIIPSFVVASHDNYSTTNNNDPEANANRFVVE